MDNSCDICDRYAIPPETYDAMLRRIADAGTLLPHLGLLDTDAIDWSQLYRCPISGSYWIGQYPHPESHGGGGVLLTKVTLDAPAAWRDSVPRWPDRVRQAHEDHVLLDSFGEEVGPETCGRAGCRRLRIEFSIYCRCHHFEALTSRICPEPSATRANKFHL